MAITAHVHQLLSKNSGILNCQVSTHHCLCLCNTHTHAVLNDNFPVEPGLVSCPLTFIFQLFLSDASSWDSPNLFISTHCNTIPPCFSWTSATHDGDKCTLYCKVNSHHYSPQEPLKGFITFGHIGIHTGLNQCGLRNGWLSCPPKGKVT